MKTLVVAMMAAVTLAACGPAEATPLGNESLARVFCKNLVEQQLRSPSSASFSGAGDTTATGYGGGRWLISGYVDAPNSFGTKVRSDYKCRVTWVYSGNTWQVDDLAITPR